VDFWLTDDQIALQEGMRSFVDGRFGLEYVASLEEHGPIIDTARWSELAEMGVFSLRGDGLGMREAVLVYEELGRGLVPGPLVTQHLAAGLVDGAADGSAVIGLVEAQATGTIVEHGPQCSSLLAFDITASDAAVRLVPTAHLELHAVERPLDPLSPVWRCTTPRLDGDVVASGAEARALQRDGVVLTAAMQLGVALAAVDLANEYAKQREQFGKPIGAFQAVKHMLAEMLVKAEVARSAVYAAACAIDGASLDDAFRAASVAKVMAGDAALFNGRTGIQVHGGMGFTWEVHAQRYWKRAVVLDHTFGPSEHHSELVADAL
jgi:alkylation response protein AidB-like acyl-CoA dehydrogenase